MKTAWRSLSLGALIILLTIVAYIPALRGGFIWDDDILITENPLIKAGNGLHRFWFTTEAADYWPLTSTVWWLEWRLWGNSPTGYHVVNVVLHAVNAVLVWLILQRLKIPGAWLAGLVFALHPVNVATVAWISEQKNTLSMLFYALAILLYLQFDEEGGWRSYGLALAAFLLALLSKTAVVMLPVVLLGCAWWRHGRVRRRDFLCCVPFFVLALGMGLVTVWFQYHHAIAGETVRTGGTASRWAAAGWCAWFYLGKALLPLNLTVIYPKWEINSSQWISYLPGVLWVGCFAMSWRERHAWGRPLLFGLGYFVVMLLPVLGFFDQAFYFYSLVADHWQYYAIIGAIALTVAAGEVICRRLGQQRWHWRTVACVVVTMILGAATWRRSSLYADAETLWRDNVAKNQDAWLAHNNLGVALQHLGKVPEARACYAQALRLKPDFAEAHNNLGSLLGSAGKYEEAVAQFEQALRTKPDLANAHHNLAGALMGLGRASEAIGHWQQALRIKPDYPEAHNNLASALARVGRIDEAIGHWEQALRIRPDYAAAHYNLAVALAGMGKVPEAIGHWQQALQIRPDYAEAHYNLGVALVGLGSMAEAIGHWEQAVRINPDYAEAHYNLGVALEQAGRLREAIEHYEQALRIRPDYTEAQNGLARLRATR